MRRREKEILDPARIEAVLEKASVCRLVLCDGGQPYVVPVCFGHKNHAIYFHSAPEGRKLDILSRNSRVCVELETDVVFIPNKTACKWDLKYRSVIGFGRAIRLEAPDEKREALAVITGHYAHGPFVFSEDILKRTVVFKIELESLTGKQSGYE